MRHFEQAYINNILTRLRDSQALREASVQLSQQQAQPHQPTDADFSLAFSRMDLSTDGEDKNGLRSGSDKDSEGALRRISEEDSDVWR